MFSCADDDTEMTSMDDVVTNINSLLEASVCHDFMSSRHVCVHPEHDNINTTYDVNTHTDDLSIIHELTIVLKYW